MTAKEKVERQTPEGTVSNIVRQLSMKHEITYLVTMAHTRKALFKGLISKADYQLFNQKMLAKYTPVYGRLLSEKDLIEGDFRALI